MQFSFLWQWALTGAPQTFQKPIYYLNQGGDDEDGGDIEDMDKALNLQGPERGHPVPNNPQRGEIVFYP